MIAKVDSVNIGRARKPARRAAYHHGNLREALIDEGLAALDTGAAEVPSLRELARRVGVSANAAYRHFDSREGLLVAMASAGFRKLAAAQQTAAAAHPQSLDGLRACGRAYVDFARANPALFRLMFGRFASSHRSPELNDAADAASRALYAGAAAVTGVGADDPRGMARALHAWSLVHGLSNLLLDGQLDHFDAPADALIDAVLQQAAPVRPR